LVSLLTEETECDRNAEPFTPANRHPAIGFRLPLAAFYGFQALDVRTSDGRRWLSLSFDKSAMVRAKRHFRFALAGSGFLLVCASLTVGYRWLYKLGFTALGRDINPVACESVRVALGPLDRDALL
jgi:hypothetical protein